jgi:hypothetical protein
MEQHFKLASFRQSGQALKLASFRHFRYEAARFKLALPKIGFVPQRKKPLVGQ